MKSKYITHQLIDGKLVTTPRRLYRSDKYKGWKTRTRVSHIMLDTTTTPVTFLSHYNGGAVMKAMSPEQLADIAVTTQWAASLQQAVDQAQARGERRKFR